MERKITVRQTTPFHLLIAGILLLIGLLLGLLIGRIILGILLMLPGVGFSLHLIFWVLECDTSAGEFTYRTLTQGVRTFTVSDIRSKRISDGGYQRKNEQYEIYVHKDGMSERICMPLSRAEALREYLEAQPQSQPEKGTPAS